MIPACSDAFDLSVGTFDKASNSSSGGGGGENSRYTS